MTTAHPMLAAPVPAGPGRSARGVGSVSNDAIALHRTGLAPSRCRVLPPRHTLFVEGDVRLGLVLVESGCVALTKCLEDGRRQIVDLVGAGDVVGFGGGDRHDCGAETLTDCRLSAWGPGGEGACRSLSEHMNRALSRQRDHAFLLGRKMARERVASGLLRLAELLSDDGRRFQCPLTRQDLGDWLGLAIETVSRALSGLQRDGSIAIRHHAGFELRDIRRLAALASGIALRPGGCSFAGAPRLRNAS